MQADMIKEVVRSFAEGGDFQDVLRVAPLLHPAFRVATFMGGQEQVGLLSKDEYLALLSARKIGGTPRKLEILGVEELGERQAVVQAVLEGEKMTFACAFHLVKEDGAWQILHDFPALSSSGKVCAMPRLD